MVIAALDAVREKKGEEVTVYDMRGFTPFVDYNLIISASSATQAKVIQDAVLGNLRDLGIKSRSVEGDPGSGWVLIDFWDLVVHIFRPELRSYYNLEGLWADLPSLRVNQDEMATGLPGTL